MFFMTIIDYVSEKARGSYYICEGISTVSKGRLKIYFRPDGNSQLRDSKTGRFVSTNRALESLAG